MPGSNELLKQMLNENNGEPTPTVRSDTLLREMLGYDTTSNVSSFVEPVPVVQERTATDTSSGADKDEEDPTKGATRPRRQWWVRTGRVIGVLVLIGACSQVVQRSVGLLFSGVQQSEINPSDNPYPYGRGVALLYGDLATKQATLDIYDAQFRDCMVGRPDGNTRAPIDEELAYVRPLFHVFEQIRNGNLSPLQQYAAGSYDSAVSTTIIGNLNNDFGSLVRDMRSTTDSYAQIDMFIAQVADGLEDSDENRQKIGRLKNVLQQSLENRQRQGMKVWEALPTDYFVLPQPGVQCFPMGYGEKEPDVAYSRRLTKADGKVYKDAVGRLRRQVGIKD